MKFQNMLLVLLMTHAYIVSVFSITPDINAAIKDVFSSLANVELMMEDANEEATDKPNDINCGGFRATTCADCKWPTNKAAWVCNGDCTISKGKCVDKPKGVSCGNYRANTCAECPGNKGESECNGECKWRENTCIHQDVLEPDILKHDCTNIKTIKKGEFPEAQKNNPMLARISVDKNGNKRITKWNHAYGIPVVGLETESDETVKRACYLLRYLFADNEWLRRTYYNQKYYFYANVGGTCCPPKMGNQGLSCRCNKAVPYSLTPAHEAAHQYLRSVQKATVDGKIKMPEFTNTTEWSYILNPDRPQWTEKDPWKLFLWNSWKKDKPYWGLGDHYYIKNGQDGWLGLNKQGRLLDEARAVKMKTNPELVKMMKLFWPCNNPFVMVCKDAAYNYKAGAAQTLKIGKADPNDPTKMICHDDLDKAEVSSRGDRNDPTDDDYQGRAGDNKQDEHATYCTKILKKAGWYSNTNKRTCTFVRKGGCVEWSKFKIRSKVRTPLDECKEMCKGEATCGGFTLQSNNNNCLLLKDVSTCTSKGEGQTLYKCAPSEVAVGEVNDALREGKDNYDGGKDTEQNWYLQQCCAKTAKFPYAMN